MRFRLRWGVGRWAMGALLATVLAGCTHPDYRAGLDALAEGRSADGIASIEKAVRDRPRDAEMKTTARTAASYLANRAYPQAAALGVALEVVAPGRYRVQPQDSYDGAGNRHYALIDDADGGHYAFSGLT